MWNLAAQLRPMSLVLTVCMASILNFASAQSSGTPRTRIGVTLAGGGASGLAHIGILCWMEEHRIPIDDNSDSAGGPSSAACGCTAPQAIRERAMRSLGVVVDSPGLETRPDNDWKSVPR